MSDRKATSSTRVVSTFALCMVLAPTKLTSSDAVVPPPSGDPVIVSARGLHLISVSLPALGQVSSCALSIGVDGREFQQGYGLPRSGNLFKMILPTAETTQVLVVAVARWIPGHSEFTFVRTGTYYARWNILFDNRDTPLQLEQTITVKSPRPDDIKFLERLSDVTLLKDLFGEGVFDDYPKHSREKLLSSQGEDARALMVVQELLQATRESVSWEIAGLRNGSLDSALRWADVLWEMAQEMPDSTYAPYAASYAGCAYSAQVCATFWNAKQDRQSKGQTISGPAEYDVLTAAARNDAHFATANAALDFAGSHGDAYLRPRALYYKSFICWLSGDLELARSFLDKASSAAPGEPTLTKWILELRTELASSRVGHN